MATTDERAEILPKASAQILARGKLWACLMPLENANPFPTVPILRCVSFKTGDLYGD